VHYGGRHLGREGLEPFRDHGGAGRTGNQLGEHLDTLAGRA